MQISSRRVYTRLKNRDHHFCVLYYILPLFRIEDAQRVAAEDLIFDRRREDYDPLESFIGLFPSGAAAKEPTSR